MRLSSTKDLVPSLLGTNYFKILALECRWICDISVFMFAFFQLILYIRYKEARNDARHILFFCGKRIKRL